MDAVARAETGRRARWSPARLYLVISGAFLVVAGLTGFTVDASFPTSPSGVHPVLDDAGVFATNGWHNVTGLVSGLISLAFATRPEWARTGAFVKGGIYVVATTAFQIWGGETFLIAVNGADQILHATLAVAGIATALATPRTGAA